MSEPSDEVRLKCPFDCHHQLVATLNEEAFREDGLDIEFFVADVRGACAHAAALRVLLAMKSRVIMLTPEVKKFHAAVLHEVEVEMDEIANGLRETYATYLISQEG